MEEMGVEWLQLIRLDETDSTNTRIRQCEAVREMTVVTAEYQTAGRGQRGNSWESERGENLSFSILIRPAFVKASEQFILSQAVSLAIQQTLEEYVRPVRIKWPNDIYWNDRKICGILIENELNGKQIERCVLGIGLNVNQREFRSDAPNPVSLYQILGMEQDRDRILMKILFRFRQELQRIAAGESKQVAQEYFQALYRKKGFHAYRDKDGIFEARMEGVEPQGFLLLRDREGGLRRYAFKEVSIVLGRYFL